MPSLRFPRRIPTPNFGFVKKLLPKRTKSREAASSEVIVGKEKSSKVTEKEVPPEECPVCRDPVGIPNPEGILESWVQLHCGHKFGTHCIQTWLQESAERDVNSSPCCPLCRTIAKHPCGHPISSPLSSQFTIFLARQPSTPRRSRSSRPRRRLSRRAGHPRRPPIQPVLQQRPNATRLVQAVGDCSICKAAAEMEKNMILAPAPAPRPHPDDAASSSAASPSRGRGRRGLVIITRDGIRAAILRFKRQGQESSILTARPGTRTILVGESGERYSGVVEAMEPEDAGYGSRHICRVHIEGTIPRTPTPMQATLQAGF